MTWAFVPLRTTMLNDGSATTVILTQFITTPLGAQTESSTFVGVPIGLHLLQLVYCMRPGCTRALDYPDLGRCV